MDKGGGKVGGLRVRNEGMAKGGGETRGGLSWVGKRRESYGREKKGYG